MAATTTPLHTATTEPLRSGADTLADASATLRGVRAELAALRTRLVDEDGS